MPHSTHHKVPATTLNSGYVSPQVHHYFGGSGYFPVYQPQQTKSEWHFSSPVQLRYDTMYHEMQYEASPPYDNDDDEDNRISSIRQNLEQIVSDDDAVLKIADDKSVRSISSPGLSAVGGPGLRVPVSNF